MTRGTRNCRADRIDGRPDRVSGSFCCQWTERIRIDMRRANAGLGRWLPCQLAQSLENKHGLGNDALVNFALEYCEHSETGKAGPADTLQISLNLVDAFAPLLDSFFVRPFETGTCVTLASFERYAPHGQICFGEFRPGNRGVKDFLWKPHPQDQSA